MEKVSKISLKQISKKDDLGSSELVVLLSGNNIDYIIANTIRRTILSEIPIYSFNEFKFEKNTSIFHNDYIKLRLRHIPIWNIENNIDTYDINVDNTEVKKEEEDEDDENNDLEPSKSPNYNVSMKQLTMYVNYKNKSNEIYTVSTNDAKFYYDEKQIDSPYKVPIPIVKLQANQEIAFSAITKLGIEQEHTMYSAVCVSGYKEISMTEFEYMIESRGQITEKRIIEVALINVIKQIGNLLKLIKEDKLKPEPTEEGLLIINNMDHTMGNLITRGLQMHKKINFAGYNLPHPRVKKVHFHYKLKGNDNIIKIIEEVIEYYLEIFETIKLEAAKLS